MTTINEKTWISPKVKISTSKLGGKGMFATQNIVKGEKVVIWGGSYVGNEEAMLAKSKGKLVMQWDDDLYSVEERGDDDSYFINHSCDPNLWMVDAFTLVAKRDISSSEELTADYVLWEADEDYVSQWSCTCNSPLCRDRVTGRDWQSRDLQERYKDHFSPLINKRILNSKKPFDYR
jgi:uncharacterized protein